MNNIKSITLKISGEYDPLSSRTYKLEFPNKLTITTQNSRSSEEITKTEITDESILKDVINYIKQTNICSEVEKELESEDQSLYIDAGFYKLQMAYVHYSVIYNLGQIHPNVIIGLEEKFYKILEEVSTF